MKGGTRQPEGTRNYPRRSPEQGPIRSQPYFRSIRPSVPTDADRTLAASVPEPGGVPLCGQGTAAQGGGHPHRNHTQLQSSRHCHVTSPGGEKCSPTKGHLCPAVASIKGPLVADRLPPQSKGTLRKRLGIIWREMTRPSKYHGAEFWSLEELTGI